MMRIERARIPDVLFIHAIKRGDDRGFFCETYKRSALAAFGVDLDWPQDNHAFSATSGVLRGLHFQRPPAAQAKLLRVVRGAIFDVAVDIRRASPTYGHHTAVELQAESGTQILVPAGFAHGYCTLTDNTEVLYKVSAEYAPETEAGLAWDDPDLGIAWPIAGPVLSPRDRHWPRLRDLDSPF